MTRRPCWWSFNTIECFFSKNFHENGVKFPEERNAFGLDHQRGRRDQELLMKELVQYFCACAVNTIRALSRIITTMTLNSLNPPCTLTTSTPFVTVLGVHTFGPDNSNPTRPMSFPNYSDPLVANWSSGRDSITLTPSIFDSAMLGTYGPFEVKSNCTVGLYWGTNFSLALPSSLRLCERPGRDSYQSALWNCFGGRIFNMAANSSPKTVPECTLTTILTQSLAQLQSGE